MHVPTRGGATTVRGLAAQLQIKELTAARSGSAQNRHGDEGKGIIEAVNSCHQRRVGGGGESARQGLSQLWNVHPDY